MNERKTVFITGASRGIGHSTAQHFVSKGWRAITCSREGVPPQCPRNERHAHITIDLSQTGALDEAMRELDAILDGGELHALVNNAGFSPKAEDGSRLGCLDGDLSIWQKTFAINFIAPVFFSRAAAPLLARTGGAIVNITSIAGHRGFQDHLCYAASKAGLEGATRVMAKELGPHGIRVNAVAPTITLTELAAEAWSDPEKSAPMMVRHPVNRFAEAEEVAQSIAMLLSDDSSMISGAVLPVDGGFLAV